jgi:hypothetical protein
MIRVPSTARQRCDNQTGRGSPPATPSEVVRSLGAIQAQDYHGALWAVGLRTHGATEESIERALADRSIIRTWPMRGTLHLVAAEDVHGMLSLLAPRIPARGTGRERQLGLTVGSFARCQSALEKALRGGGRMTRRDIYALFERSGVSPAGQRGIHIIGRLAQEGVICHGPRAGAQETFVLLEEWIPPGKPRPRDAVLVDLALRYFTSHGPATLKDFAWWAGVSLTDAKRSLERPLPGLMEAERDGQRAWGPPARPAVTARPTEALLLPPFDELLVAYKDRSAMLDPVHAGNLTSLLHPTIVIRGRVIGTWTRATRKRDVSIATRYFGAPAREDLRAVERAMRRYGEFLGKAIHAG